MLRSEGKTEYRLPAAAFLLTAALVLFLFALRGVTPFGDGSLLFSDAATQYVSIWAYFRDALLGRQDWICALEKTLGGGTLALFSYYAASPFNLLYLLFPADRMPLAFSLIVLLKLSCCSLTLALFFRGSDGGLRPFSLLYTTAYALCGYCVAYFWSAMWLDGVLLLPLAALGLRRLRQGCAPWLYLFALAGAIFTSFYTGYMLCLFSVLYYLYLLLCDGTPQPRVFLRFCLSSLAAGGLCAFVLLPAMLSMRGGKQASFTAMVSDYYGEMAQRIGGRLDLPLSAGLLIALLLVGITAFATALWLFCRKSRAAYGWKLAALLALPLLLSLYDLRGEGIFFLHKLLIGAASFAEINNGKPNLYVGLLPLAAAAVYFLRPAGKSRERLCSALFLLVLLGSMRFFVPNLIWHGFTKNICFNYRYSFVFCFFLLSLANEASLPKLEGKRLAAWALAAVQLASLLLPADITLRNLQEYFHPSAAVFAESDREMRAQIAAMDADSGDGLYRASLSTEINGPLQYNFNGLTSFTSTASRRDVVFLQRLGLASDDLAWASGVYGRSGAIDTLLGIRYRTDGPVNAAACQLPGTELYENPTVLPLLFPASSTAAAAVLDSADALENLNLAFRALSPETGLDVYGGVEILERRVDGLTDLGDDRYEGDGEIVYRLRTTRSGPLYLYLADGRDHAAQVLVNGAELARVSDQYGWHILYLCASSAGEELTVTLRPMPETGLSLRDRPCFGVEDEAALEAYAQALGKGLQSEESRSDTRFTAVVQAGADQLLVATFPYDAGWRASVDGKDAQTCTALGYFLAVPLPPGEHTVTLRYVPEGLGAGFTISAVSLAGILIVLLKKKTRK